MFEVSIELIKDLISCVPMFVALVLIFNIISDLLFNNQIMKIYVPSDNTYNKCYVVQNEDVIRGYDRVPQNNSTYNYRDYYIHSDYIYKDGTGQWSQYTTLPVCLNSSVITNDFYHRVDLSNIMIIFYCYNQDHYDMSNCHCCY